MEKQVSGLQVDLGFDHPAIVRNRITQQLEQAKQHVKESDTQLETAQAMVNRAKHNREAAKKRLDTIQKQRDELGGKAAPESQASPKKNSPKKKVGSYAPNLPSRPALASARGMRYFASNCPSPPLRHSASPNDSHGSVRQYFAQSNVGTGCQL